MKKTKILLSAMVVMIASIMYSDMAMTNSSVPPVSRTGAPLEGNCASCHSGNLNSGSGSITYSMESLSYIPDSTYTTILQVSDGNKVRFGFQLTVLDSNDNMAGSFTITNTALTSSQTNLGRGYVNHKAATTNEIWSFDWTAPSTDIGPITFYLCGNATNNASNTSGDNVYMRSVTIETCNLVLSDSIVGSYSDSSGIIDLTVNNGLAPLTFMWSNGVTTEDLTDLDSGSYSVTVTDASGCIAISTIVIPIWIGFDNDMQKVAFKVYPNPSTGIFRIESQVVNANLSVYDIQGSLIFQDRVLSFNHAIDLSTLGTGIYTLVLSNEHVLEYKKIVIQ